MGIAAVLPSVRRGRARTPFGALANVCDRIVESQETITWPSPRYRDDPVGFARDILGIELWDRQIEILESIRDNRNTTVKSGHKCGKTTTIAVAALWFFCSFERARVVLTAVKASQIDQAVWKEVRRLYREAAKRGTPIGGEIHELARSGLRDPADDRQIWGITARDGEGLAGISGPNVLVLSDEASGIHDRFFEVLGSSLAGSGGTVRKCYISNPTRTTGEFFRSHTSNKALFKCITVSSEETPNARGTGVVPGLAGPEWIAERKAEYGEDSPSYCIRVKGEFATNRDGKIISAELIAMAESGWELVEAEGQLQIGIDPAGDGVIGDETAIAVRRGNKIVTVIAWRGLTEEATVAHAVSILAQQRRPQERTRPRVAVDAEGGIGSRVLGFLRAYLDMHPDAFELIVVRSGRKMWGSPEYDLVRDALWGHAEKWLSAGGVIPTDAKLAEELNAPIFTHDKNMRYVATPKKELRKLLGRSPDRADATCIAIWGYQSDEAESDDVGAIEAAGRSVSAPAEDDEDLFGNGGALDPYGARDLWSKGY